MLNFYENYIKIKKKITKWEKSKKSTFYGKKQKENKIMFTTLKSE